MSDIGDTFKALKEVNREKKQDNLAKSTSLLVERGVAFESHNGGVHLVVSGSKGLIDFWPSTGKYITRYSRKDGRGVHNLIKELE